MNLFKFIKGSFTNKRKSKMRSKSNKTKTKRLRKSKTRRMSKRMKGG
jgi:hypothetical protein